MLTSGPRNKIQYTNQPSFTDDGDEVPASTRNASLPGSLGWDDWVVHRMDWTPERTVWYVSGHEVANIQFQTPKDPAQVIFNAWSDGGSWSGKMAMHHEAYLQIQWIEMVYNASNSDTGTSDEKRKSRRDLGPVGPLSRRDGDGSSGCNVVCDIDEGTVTESAGVVVGGSQHWVWPVLSIMVLFFYI